MARSAPYERPESTIDRETEEKSPSEIGNREEERGERREEENETGKRKGEPSWLSRAKLLHAVCVAIPRRWQIGLNNPTLSNAPQTVY